MLKRTAGTATAAASAALYLLSGNPLSAAPIVPVEAQLPLVNVGDLVQILRHRGRIEAPEGSQEGIPPVEFATQFWAVQETSDGSAANRETPAFRAASDNNIMSGTSQPNFLQSSVLGGEPPATSVHAEEPRQATRADFPDFQPITPAEAHERAMALLTKADLAHEKYLGEEARHSSLGSDLA